MDWESRRRCNFDSHVKRRVGTKVPLNKAATTVLASNAECSHSKLCVRKTLSSFCYPVS